MLANMDFRVLKYFPFGETAKLDVVAEAFNLFNRANVAQVNPVFGLGLTALPSVASGLSLSRQLIQLAGIHNFFCAARDSKVRYRRR